MNFTIQRSTPQDAARLTEIAHAAKKHWGYPDHWMELWRDALTITADFIEGNEVYSAVIERRVIAFYAIVISGDRAVLDHLWLMPDCIGAGVGRKLFEHAARVAASLGASVMEVEADPNAEGFYQKMGGVRIGESRSKIGGEPRVLPLLAFNLNKA